MTGAEDEIGFLMQMKYLLQGEVEEEQTVAEARGSPLKRRMLWLLYQ